MNIMNHNEKISFCEKAMKELFPNYMYDPAQWNKLNSTVMLDIMSLFVKFVYQLPKELEQIAGIPPTEDNACHIGYLLPKCNQFLTAFQMDHCLLKCGDVFVPTENTFGKLVAMLNLLVCINGQDFDPSIRRIRQAIEEDRELDEDIQRLKDEIRKIDVDKECLRDKLRKMKTKEQLAQMVKDKQDDGGEVDDMKEKLRCLLAKHNQLKGECMETTRKNTELESKLVDGAKVDRMKLKLQSLQDQSNEQLEYMQQLRNQCNSCQISLDSIESYYGKIAVLQVALNEQDKSMQLQSELSEKMKASQQEQHKIDAEISALKNRLAESTSVLQKTDSNDLENTEAILNKCKDDLKSVQDKNLKGLKGIKDLEIELNQCLEKIKEVAEYNTVVSSELTQIDIEFKENVGQLTAQEIIAHANILKRINEDE